jgi:hypothetical protein
LFLGLISGFLGFGACEGVSPTPEPEQSAPIHVVSDSMLLTASDNDGTQLLCSPSQLLNTSVAMETLKDLDDHDKALQEQVHGWKSCYPHMQANYIYQKNTPMCMQ